MTKSSRLVLLSTVLVTLFFIPHNKVIASTMKICFKSGVCYIVEGKCTGWCPGTTGSPTCSDFNAQSYAATAYISAPASGGAWLVEGQKKTQIASDSLLAFIAATQKKYAKANLSDATVQASITSDYEKFLTHDDQKVSATRVSALVKELQVHVSH